MTPSLGRASCGRPSPVPSPWHWTPCTPLMLPLCVIEPGGATPWRGPSPAWTPQTPLMRPICAISNGGATPQRGPSLSAWTLYRIIISSLCSWFVSTVLDWAFSRSCPGGRQTPPRGFPVVPGRLIVPFCRSGSFSCPVDSLGRMVSC